MNEMHLVTTWEQDIDEAKKHMSATAFHAIAAGKALSDAKDKHREQFGGKGWQEAVEGRGISLENADQLIQVYVVFGQNPVIDYGILNATQLRRLAAPSVPESAREEVLERAEAGEKLTVRETERIIAEAKEEGRREAEQNAELQREKLVEEARERVEYWKQRAKDEEQEVERLKKQPISPEVKKQIQDLQREAKSSNATAEKLQKELTKLREQEKERKEQEKLDPLVDRLNSRDYQVKLHWKANTANAVAILRRLIGERPQTPDLSSFTWDEWSRLGELESALQDALQMVEELEDIRTGRGVVDAEAIVVETFLLEDGKDAA